jgi:tRNA (mo5U34)-methyltransferase
VTLSELLFHDLSRVHARYPFLDLAALLEAQLEIFTKTQNSGRSKSIQLVESLVALKPREIDLSVDQPSVKFSGNASPEFSEALMQALKQQMPWRKGPFEFFGTKLDAEWRCDLKFDRLNLPSLAGKKVADVGCGNGYYMYRLLSKKPELVLGFDPTDRYLIQYYLLRLLSSDNLPLGFFLTRDQDLQPFANFFDVILCLGVLYHHPTPDALLRNLFTSLKSSGELFLETLYAPKETIDLQGNGRYARMKNIYLIPSIDHLTHLIEEAGFRNIEITSKVTTTDAEQRRTPWAPGNSLMDYLNPEDPSLTEEGYPRPERVIVRAKKGS